MSKEQIEQQIKDTFKAVDTDGSGKLSCKELKECIKLLMPQLSEEELTEVTGVSWYLCFQ